ncbi:MAG: DNA cytosine methyltransferase [Gammaproteobacteria bacterium]|nr:DNA cytosine methyltransferase [Gammaproteobacteria bacterium]MYD81059.1 DNA cytosine methyltransferase [Gammaproteobacteria bacterium]
MKHPAVSLFSGAGGLDVGVDKAGFKTLCSIELDPHCVSTLRRNSRQKTVWQVDIRVLDPSRVAFSLGARRKDLALLYGGPPTQPVNQLGLKKGISHPQDHLALEMVRFAQALRPSAVLIAQAPRFLKTKYSPKALLKDVLAEEFKTIGYDLHQIVLDAVDYGIPQNRKQVFIVCLPRDQTYEFPYQVLLSAPSTAEEAIDGLPPAVKPEKDPGVPNHIDATPPRDRVRIAYVREGDWLSKSDAPPDIIQKLTPRDSTKFRRLDRSLPAPTLRSGERLFHPVEDRYLTPRETARIQGFEDRYVFHGPIRRLSGSVRDLDQHSQVANAVPPPFAQVIARSVKAALRL